MSIVVTFRPTGGINAYEAALARLETQNELLQVHRLAHYASGTDNNFQVVDVWSSEKEFNNFASILIPVLNKVGLEPGVPEIRQMVNTILSGVALLDDIGLEYWNNHDPIGWAALFADQFVLSDPSLPKAITTREGAQQYIQGWLTAFPDMRVRRLDRVVSEYRVAGFIEFAGTHTGPLVGSQGTLEATGKHVTGTGAYVVTVDSQGRVSSFAGMPDVLGLMLQLGVDPTGTRE